MRSGVRLDEIRNDLPALVPRPHHLIWVTASGTRELLSNLFHPVITGNGYLLSAICADDGFGHYLRLPLCGPLIPLVPTAGQPEALKARKG